MLNRSKIEKKASLDVEQRDREKEKERERGRTKKRSKKTIEIRTVLKFGFPQQPIHNTMLNHIPDLVQRYGAQFKEVMQCELEAARAEDNFQSLYNKWTMVDKEKIDQTDLRDLLRAVRMTHTCRAPLLFSSLRESFFVPTGGDSFFCTSAGRVHASETRTRSHSGQSTTKGSCFSCCCFFSSFFFC